MGWDEDTAPGSHPGTGGPPVPGSGSGSAAASAVADAAARLHRIPPEDFVAARDALVAEARAAGDRASATEIAGFKRPTRAAWLANLLVAEAPDEVDGLLDLAAPLADAQQSLDGAALRRVSAQRNALVGSLARRAAQLGRATGRRIEPALEREVRVVLESALADEELAARVRSGRLVRFERHSGFGPLAGAPDPDTQQAAGIRTAPEPTVRRAQPDPPARGRSAARRQEREQDAALRRAREQQERRQKAVADAEDLLERTRLGANDAVRERDDARERADAATGRRDDAHRRVEELRAELDRARSAVTAADREAKSAEREADDAARRARSTAAEVARAEQAVEDLREL
ncbi:MULTISPECIES: hypothetical protein [Pseudonocardia]|uniref:Uncharacterized protein n=2 Tax=Pseudonocardia TaxID=1847 RepID=A0A1Y2N6R3_PSEAH|nr:MULTISPECIES: hypothetical protein [Pseudonocardia]OSY43162.1 hypothetical protein BG845_00767 [Pseudonocardia autotrophica]TDN71650.1 hypothetical protein C8E95_0684 [Pseudonocardia autotrophica]BBG02337.1 hypothetical protein Pdca_35460 [Pseudonocardia autotrophica]GEC23327.1 hypothetical protein PSA01_03560 [Pseudonocardia saturnea]